MSLPTFREMLKDPRYTYDDEGIRTLDMFAAARDYGIMIRNATLEWAAENAEAGASYGFGDCLPYVVEESIMNGKITKELEI